MREGEKEKERRKKREEERKGLIIQFQVWGLVTVGLLRAFTISLKRTSLVMLINTCHRPGGLGKIS